MVNEQDTKHFEGEISQDVGFRADYCTKAIFDLSCIRTTRFREISV